MATERQCLQAIDAHADALEQRANFVGLGVQPLLSTGRKGSDFAVVVYVTRKLPKSRLERKDLVPERLPIRDRGRTVQVPTRVVEQGEVVLEGGGG